MTSDDPEAGSTPPGQDPHPRNEPDAGDPWPAQLVPPPEGAGGSPPVPPPSAASLGQPAPGPQTPPVAQGSAVWGRQGPPGSGEPTAPQTGWGASTPPPPGGQPPSWGPPPAQPGGWPPGPGAPGGPPGGWAPVPARSDNGCLKGCLIIGIVVVVLGILGVVALGFIATRFVEDAGINADGSFDQCQLISAADVEAVLGPDAAALPLGGLVDVTVGQVLDQRLLPDAPDCWLISDSGSSITGRLAREDGNGAAVFEAARRDAMNGGFLASDEAFGDEAFCTAATEFGGFGALVRRGDRVAYVSLLTGNPMQGQGGEVNARGQLVSPSTCQLAGQLAEAALK